MAVISDGHLTDILTEPTPPDPPVTLCCSRQSRAGASSDPPPMCAHLAAACVTCRPFTRSTAPPRQVDEEHRTAETVLKASAMVKDKKLLTDTLQQALESRSLKEPCSRTAPILLQTKYQACGFHT